MPLKKCQGSGIRWWDKGKCYKGKNKKKKAKKQMKAIFASWYRGK